MFNDIRGVITFKAIGADLEDFINKVKSSKIPCFNIRSVDGAIIGKIYNKHYKELCYIATKQKIEISIESKKGLVYKAKRYKRRYGIIAGLIIATCFIFYMSNTVLKIEISGNVAIGDEQILSILNDNGISYGKFIPNLNYLNAERNMTTSMKNLAWVGIRNTGGRVVVEIDEMVKSPDVVPINVPCNIVATKSAQIINAKVYCGQLIPKIGDGVKEGDLLISGTAIDKKGKSTILHAQGKIIGRYEDKMTFTQDFQSEQNLLTGEELNKREFSFFGLKIPLYLGGQVDGEYEYNESTTNFSFFNITLPIGITHQTYRPFKNQIVTYTKDEAEAEIQQKILNYEENLLKNQIIISKEIQKSDDKNQMQIVVLYTLEGEIGISKELMAKN